MAHLQLVCWLLFVVSIPSVVLCDFPDLLSGFPFFISGLFCFVVLLLTLKLVKQSPASYRSLSGSAPRVSE